MFVGAVEEEDKVALLELCYAVAFPSHLRSEAFGISLLEGAMYGKPMISRARSAPAPPTSTSTARKMAETGLVVPPDRPRLIWRKPRRARLPWRELRLWPCAP
jgi:glycosyltransferase involved in cell wall biosynthesis